jgi:hypothetical protein
MGEDERRTASQDLFQLQPLVFGEPVGVAGDPAGDCRTVGAIGSGFGATPAGAQRVQVGADGLEAAAITEFESSTAAILFAAGSRLVRLRRTQWGAFGDHGLLHRPDEVVPQVPAVGDLNLVPYGCPHRLGVGAGPVRHTSSTPGCRRR